MGDPVNFPQEDIDELFVKAKQLGIFRGSTKEDLLSTLTAEKDSISETLDFSGYPASVVQRIGNSPKGLSKLLDIKIVNFDSEKGNTIEVGGKRLSILTPEVDGKEVFKCPKKFGFQNVRYIKGKAIDSELEKAGKQLFDTTKEFDDFIMEHIPGTTRNIRYINFAELMGLKKFGARGSDHSWRNMGKSGHIWVTRIKKEVEPKDVINHYKEKVTYSAGGIGFNDEMGRLDHDSLACCAPLIGFEEI